MCLTRLRSILPAPSPETCETGWAPRRRARRKTGGSGRVHNDVALENGTVELTQREEPPVAPKEVGDVGAHGSDAPTDPERNRVGSVALRASVRIFWRAHVSPLCDLDVWSGSGF